MEHAYPVLLSALLFAGTATAQPTIDQSNFAPSPGESFVLNASAWMDPGPSGANVTWDFSALVIDSTFTYAYVDPASTPMTDSFPTATLAYAEGGGYAYRSFDATGGYYLGYHMGGTSPVVDYQDPELTFQFPCTYGTQWVDDLYADYLPGPAWFYAGSINAEADGYGTLILPYGTFTNVLRLHLIRNTTLETQWPEDEYYVDTIYYYLHPGTHYPLVEVFSNTLVDAISPPPPGVRWLGDPFAGVQGTVAPANALVAVAQGDGLVRLDLSLNAGGAATIDVIDAAGRIVAQDRLGLGAGASSHTLAVSALRPGLYTVRMLLNDQQMTTRLVMP
jgi:hypothetical protein